MQRDFFHALPGWQFDRVEGRNRVYRKVEKVFGQYTRRIGDDIVLVFESIAVKEWDGRVLRKRVVVRQVGFKHGGDDAPTQWFS